MIEFGKSLRLAREEKGLTISQIAEETRLAPAIINDLENEDFRQIAAPIYGRGFVRLYCEALGLDAQVYIDEFTTLFNSLKEAQAKEHLAVASAPIETSQTTTELFQTPEPSVDKTLSDAGTAEEKLSISGERPLFSRYAPNVHQIPTIPPTVWRMGVLILLGLVVLTLLFMGLRALHHATLPTQDETQSPATVPHATEIQTPRKPLAVTPLYID